MSITSAFLNNIPGRGSSPRTFLEKNEVMAALNSGASGTSWTIEISGITESPVKGSEKTTPLSSYHEEIHLPINTHSTGALFTSGTLIGSEVRFSIPKGSAAGKILQKLSGAEPIALIIVRMLSIVSKNRVTLITIEFHKNFFTMVEKDSGQDELFSFRCGGLRKETFSEYQQDGKLKGQVPSEIDYEKLTAK